jgi:hypothetical protein
MKLNYQFTASGLGDIIKARIYTLRPEEMRKDVKESHSDSGYHEVMQPLVDARQWYGKYALCELMLISDGVALTVPEAVVSVTRRKEIVTTRVVGGNGTIKEFIADGDMDISITIGIVATADDGKTLLHDAYPEEEMRILLKILDSRKSIDVFSDFLELFEISKIVITDYSLVQTTHTNRQVVTINTVSDADYVIYSEEN